MKMLNTLMKVECDLRWNLGKHNKQEHSWNNTEDHFRNIDVRQLV